MIRLSWFRGTYVSVFCIGLSSAVHPTPRFLWNATASTPIGLYAVSTARNLKVGDLAVITPPDRIGDFLAAGSYLPKHVPLLKHVRALRGQTVCRNGSTILIDGEKTATALEHDSHGIALPIWSGCQVLADDEVFVLNDTVPGSFDSRYFGSIPTSSVIGRATPLWIISDSRSAIAEREAAH